MSHSRQLPSNVSLKVIDATIQRIPVDVLNGFTRHLLERHGLTPEHAEIMTANLVEADMRGVKSHGHWLMKRYSDWLNTGYMNCLLYTSPSPRD